MKARPTIITFLVLLLCGTHPLLAQWSGRANLSTGLGGMMGNEDLKVGFLGHIVTQGDVSLLYKTDRFSWATTVGGSVEAKSSDNSRLNMSFVGEDALGLEVVYKTVKTRPMHINFRSDVGFKPASNRNYSAWIAYRYSNDRATNVSNSLSGTMKATGQQIQHYFDNPRELVEGLKWSDMDSHTAGCYYETPRLNEHSASAGAGGQWLLTEKNLLLGGISLSTVGSRKNTVWSVFKTDRGISGDIDPEEAFNRGEASMFRITPSCIDLDFAANIHLKNTVRNDSVRINWGPGVRVFGNHSLDRNSGATMDGINPDGSYAWRDSLRLKEDFNFLAVNAAPFVTAECHWKKIDIYADYALQFYFCRLNDDTRRQPLNLQSVSPSGNSSFVWRISDIHKLGVTHNIGVDYPDYLQICWYDRTGGYIDQLFRGNEGLKSTLHSSYGFTYELKYKRFLYQATCAITRRINEIDQTWTNEEIEGRLYKVFRWVNSADSWSFGTSQRFLWQGKVLNAGLGVGYNQSRRTSSTDASVKDASDWNVSANATFNLGKGWTIGADALYQSSVATFFTSFNEYWVLNARVQKQLRKITLFFNARDILDSARQTTFFSEDGTQHWVDIARENRRLFLIGMQWNF